MHRGTKKTRCKKHASVRTPAARGEGRKERKRGKSDKVEVSSRGKKVSEKGASSKTRKETREAGTMTVSEITSMTGWGKLAIRYLVRHGHLLLADGEPGDTELRYTRESVEASEKVYISKRHKPDLRDYEGDLAD
jgi:hypothetical protein